MILSKERLLQEAKESGFRGEILEKVVILMHILEDINKDAFLKSRLVLKGGTALNLFYFGLPRLSIDIDLNYIGSIDREVMLSERDEINNKINRICGGLGLSLFRRPTVHAGGKMIWRYPSVLGNQGNIEIDLNFMYRVPLLSITKKMSTSIAGQQIQNIAVLDIHELAAGKLSALFDRSAARDVFDVHYLLHNIDLNDRQLRQLFVIYIAMSRKKDLRKFDAQILNHDVKEFERKLVPMLKRKQIAMVGPINSWAELLMRECREQLSRLLPFEKNEREFLSQIMDQGIINPNLICEGELARKVVLHPALQWTVFNVKRNKEMK